MGGLQLERGSQLVEPAHLVGIQPGDLGAAVGLQPDQSLRRHRAQRSAQRVPGDAEVRAQLALDQPAAAGALAVEDLAPQLADERVDGGDPLQRAPHQRAPSAASALAARGARTASTSSPASTSPAPRPESTVSVSPSSNAPSSPAVSGSASVSVDVSAAESRRSPRANST